jgi:hypothetical protein
MKVTIETIPHDQQRYSTCGDWTLADGALTIRVSKMGNWRYEMAVAVHEVVEALLCMNDGVSQKDVDAFDMAYEANRRPYAAMDYVAEPGDDPTAPYHRQHCFATAVEMLLIGALGVPWGEYEAAVEKL